MSVPGDARDLNHDGVIDERDVEELQAICPAFPCPLPVAPPTNPDQPTISSVSPSSVAYGSTPSQVITITGSNFALGAIINVGGGGLMGTTVAGTTASATTPFVFVNSTTLRVWWPNTSLPAGIYGVTVNNPSGYAATLSRSFTITGPPPAINSLSPPSVTYGTTASQAVVLFGSGFMPGATITVGSLSGTVVKGTTATATSQFVYVNSARLAFFWPNTSLPPGSYELQVTNPAAAGGLSATRTGGFTVIPPQPIITGLSQPSLIYDVSPSQSVTIFGTSFLPGAVVTVGNVTGATVPGSVATATTPFVYVSSGQLRFYWKKTALVPGSYAVQVANPPAAGGLSASLADGLTVTSPQPTVTSLDIASVTYGITPNRPITVFGDNFVVGARITVGSITGETVVGTTASAATPFVFVNKSRLSFYWPNTALPPGPHDVQVTNTAMSGGLSATLTDAFTVAPPQPTVTSVTPTPLTYGISPGTSITIFGNNFIAGATVTVGALTGTTVPGSAATATTRFVHVTSTQVRFWWPNTSLPPGAHDVTVTNPSAAGGLSGTLPRGFSVAAPQPSVTSLAPNPVTYAVTPSLSVTVFGANFVSGAQVTIGSLSGATVAGSVASASTPFVWVNSSTLRFWWPNTGLPTGAYNVTVTNPDAAGGRSATLADGFTVAAPAPTITAVSPTPVTFGSASYAIAIFGSNFVPGATVTVGSLSGATVPGTSPTATVPFVYLNSGILRFWWPSTSLPVGTYDVQVANPAAAGGASVTLTGGFVVQ